MTIDVPNSSQQPTFPNTAVEDLSKEPQLFYARPVLEPYNPQRALDQVRAGLAIGMLVFVGLLTLASYGAVLFRVGSVDEIGKLHGFIVAPLLTMTGVIIAFYFAAQKNPPS